MAKRTRYPGRPAAKPGARRPGAGPTPGAGAASGLSRSGGLTQAELDRAAELEAELVAREQAAIAENARRRARGRGFDVGVAGDAGAALSVRAGHEYAYVARDIRRIVRTAALMLAILAGLWIALNAGSAGPV